MIDNKIKIITLTLILFGWFIFSPTLAQAQKLILTYQDISFYPSNYQGKAPGAFGSKILVKAVGINDDGKIVDLSKADFSWQLDSLYGNKKGIGITQIEIRGDKFGKNYYTVGAKAVINNQTYSGLISIPSSNVEAVIEVPMNNYTLVPGQVIKTKITPYFFSVTSTDNLEFSWKSGVSNKIVSSDTSFKLDVDDYVNKIYPSFFDEVLEISVEGMVIRKDNPIESAREKIWFKLKNYENQNTPNL